MKELHDFDTQEIRRLIEQERWNEPLSEVRRVRFTPGQRIIFWGLRAYVIVMTVVVVWAFLHRTAG